MYQISIHRRAKKFLATIPRKEVQTVIEKIDNLSRDPFTSTLDIKKLATTNRSYRLRVGNIRIVYEVDSTAKNIFIQDIGFRGNIY